MKRTIMALAALGLVAGTSVLAAPAMADDADPPAEVTTTEVVTPEAPKQEAPDPVVEDETEPKAEPVVEQKKVEAKPKPVEDEPKTETTNPDKPWICHPVNGKGETGTGWNLINPNKHSSHIDDEGNPKHTSNDGRVDTPAVNGTCPTPPDDKYPYEVDVCWTMATSDGVEGTYQFPQTRGCDTLPKCEETIEFQHDTYWIRDKADEDYLAGLTGLNSPADDAQLEPHDYYSVVKTGDECEPVVIVKEKKQYRSVYGEPNCETGLITISHQERTRTITITDGVKEKGPWSEWTEVGTEQVPVDPSECPTPPVDPPVVDTPDEPTPDTTTDVDQVLPNTGGARTFVLIIGILLVIGGAFVLLRNKRNL